MTTDTDHFDTWIFKNLRIFAIALSSIYMEKSIMGSKHFAQLANWLNRPSFVINVHDRNQHGVWAQCITKMRRIHHS
ncbi:hypothetical protein D3C80_1543780 [compost metagenome]